MATQDGVEVAQSMIAQGVPPGRILVADLEVVSGAYALTRGIVAGFVGCVVLVTLAGYGFWKLVAG
ncbi:hypothetical protein [Congregicoccus parvus]|uniref:hypothetical protein n=1 Tax=Congregicoccus parvus TaxID=3081749 RepID=UPI003FA5B2F1